MADFEWEDNEFPIAYLITFRTYGTWLHGDARTSVDEHKSTNFGTPKVSENTLLEQKMRENMTSRPFLLDGPQRGCVEAAIREVCDFRDLLLSVLNVRTNHAHVVVGGGRSPERIATDFKSYSTRKLRAEHLVDFHQKVWARGASTRYLWKPRSVELAIDCVKNHQGADLPNF